MKLNYQMKLLHLIKVSLKETDALSVLSVNDLFVYIGNSLRNEAFESENGSIKSMDELNSLYFSRLALNTQSKSHLEDELLDFGRDSKFVSTKHLKSFFENTLNLPKEEKIAQFKRYSFS